MTNSVPSPGVDSTSMAPFLHGDPQTGEWVAVWYGRPRLERFDPVVLQGTEGALNPFFSPDGEWIVYSAFQGGASSNLYRKRSNGTGQVVESGWRFAGLRGATRSGGSAPIPCLMPDDLNQNLKEPAHRWRNALFSPWC